MSGPSEPCDYCDSATERKTVKPLGAKEWLIVRVCETGHVIPYRERVTMLLLQQKQGLKALMQQEEFKPVLQAIGEICLEISLELKGKDSAEGFAWYCRAQAIEKILGSAENL